eukprot:4171249-Pleurochrysis_carterae.AAC.1
MKTSELAGKRAGGERERMRASRQREEGGGVNMEGRKERQRAREGGRGMEVERGEEGSGGGLVNAYPRHHGVEGGSRDWICCPAIVDETLQLRRPRRLKLCAQTSTETAWRSQVQASAQADEHRDGVAVAGASERTGRTCTDAIGDTDVGKWTERASSHEETAGWRIREGAGMEGERAIRAQGAKRSCRQLREAAGRH